MMNQVMNTIYERRAVRRYKSKPITKEQIDELIAAGCMAPSALNSQDWQFYILADREMIRHFGHEIGKLAFKEIGHMSLKDVIKSS
ncbi:MAG: nitroreductase family protein, partial [Flavipsychrobacter sp.]